MVGRASIQGAAETHRGNVRERNEDAHVIDSQRGIFAVFDGMGGNAGGEVASALASATVANCWGNDATQRAIDAWLRLSTPASRRELVEVVKAGVKAAHEALVAAAKADSSKQGMGTTVVGALVVGSELMFAYCGDSRAYLVRDGQALQLTEDHTLLQRLVSAGIDVDMANDGSRWNSVLTKAVGLDNKFEAVVFFVPVASGDSFLLCSDGITQYVQREEIAWVIGGKGPPSPSAQCLVDIALARGGDDNATALVVNVLDPGVSNQSAALLQRDQKAIAACPLWGGKVSPQARLRAPRMALPRTVAPGELLPAQENADRLAWIILDGKVEQGRRLGSPGDLLYPEALLADKPLPMGHSLWRAQTQVRALVVCEADFRDVCEEDPELAEKLSASLAAIVSSQATRLDAPVGADRLPLSKGEAQASVVRPSDHRVSARGSRPPIDQRGFARDRSAESPLVLALAAFAEEQAEPEISVEPWLDHAFSDATVEGDFDLTPTSERTPGRQRKD